MTGVSPAVCCRSSPLSIVSPQRRRRTASHRRFLPSPLDLCSDQWLALDRQLQPDHLARSIARAVCGLDFSALWGLYAGFGSAAYPPHLLLAVVLYETQRGLHSPAVWYRDSTKPSWRSAASCCSRQSPPTRPPVRLGCPARQATSRHQRPPTRPPRPGHRRAGWPRQYAVGTDRRDVTSRPETRWPAGKAVTGTNAPPSGLLRSGS